MSKLRLNRLNGVIQRRTSSPLKTKIHKKPRPPVLAHIIYNGERGRLHLADSYKSPLIRYERNRDEESGGRTSISKHEAVRCLHWHSSGVRVLHLKCCLMRTTKSNHLLPLLRSLQATGN